MGKEKFYQLFKKGMISLDKIDDYIEEWHIGDSIEKLHEYLGMTEQEYNKWFKDGIL